MKTRHASRTSSTLDVEETLNEYAAALAFASHDQRDIEDLARVIYDVAPTYAPYSDDSDRWEPVPYDELPAHHIARECARRRAYAVLDHLHQKRFAAHRLPWVPSLREAKGGVLQRLLGGNTLQLSPDIPSPTNEGEDQLA